jgi:hypothetical protein
MAAFTSAAVLSVEQVTVDPSTVHAALAGDAIPATKAALATPSARRVFEFLMI